MFLSDPHYLHYILSSYAQFFGGYLTGIFKYIFFTKQKKNCLKYLSYQNLKSFLKFDLLLFLSLALHLNYISSFYVQFFTDMFKLILLLLTKQILSI